MNKQSFVEVDSEVLAKACQASLDEIHATRQQDIEEAIDKMMARRFFKPKSREDALDELENKDGCLAAPTEYEMIMWYGSRREDVSEQLLGMCKLADKVYLSRDDYSRIGRFIGEEEVQ